MEAKSSSEALVSIYHMVRITRQHIPEESNLHSYHCKKPTSRILFFNVMHIFYEIWENVKVKLSVEGFETSRLPHFLDDRLTYGRKVVSLTHRRPFTSRNIPGTHFC
jgi:hypothetical protein